MPLHPDIAAITSGPPVNFAELTIAEARAAHAAPAAARPRGPEMAVVSDERLAGCDVRRYVPEGGSGAGIVFFHGGGWVLGSRDTHDAPCRYLAAGTGATVLSVDYRLAPEHPFPAAFNDAVAATTAVLDGEVGGVDPNRVAVAGDSAGGNLAAGAALQLTSRPQLRAQLLVYPALDATMASASYERFAEGPFLTRADMQWFYDQYASGVSEKDWRLSPLHAGEVGDVAPALVVTAENDVLCDEGERYAQRLAEAGIDSAAARYLGATHGFFGWMHASAPSRAVMHQACGWLRDQLG